MATTPPPLLYGQVDPNAINDEIPDCFIRGTTTLEEARSRWQKTKKWRHDRDVDDILDRPHTKFEVIHKLYCHSLHKKVSTDSDERPLWLYVERPGHSKLADLLRKEKVSMDDLEFHYTYVTEYLWRVIEPDRRAQLISIFDLDGCAMSELAGGDTLSLFKRCSSVIGQHYPERAFKIFIINAPAWMSWVWSTISPWLDPVTVKKINIIKKGKDHISAIAEFCKPDLIPQEVGGQDSTPLGASEAALKMAEHVKSHLTSSD